MVLIEIELVVLHPIMDRLLVTQPTRDILDEDKFDLLHHVYLISTTVQWFFGMIYVWCICVMWRKLGSPAAAGVMLLAVPPSLKGLALGIGAAVPIGPVNVDIALRRPARRVPERFCAGLRGCHGGCHLCGCQHSGFGRLLDRHGIAITLGIFGSALLGFLLHAIAAQCAGGGQGRHD